jgi:putative oxidoreductase
MAGIVWQQFPNGWIYTSTHGGWEYPACWMTALIAQAGLGAGAFALGAARHGISMRGTVGAPAAERA